MVVRTQTRGLEKLRRGVMELYISDHPLDCLTCAANGDCELQDQAGAVGLRDVRYGYEGANHLDAGEGRRRNPYFNFDPSKCIVCSRCVRACDEVQGTFALTIDGSRLRLERVGGQPGREFPVLRMRVVRRLRAGLPDRDAHRKSGREIGTPDKAVVTTCAYCGVGCTFRAEMRGEQLVRMVPWKDGKANRGHSCVKGRFAWGYAKHQDRILKPMIRASIDQPWREVEWDEAFAYAASRAPPHPATVRPRRVGGITSSRCTNEETYLVQKLVRAGFGNNNVDTCARVCHSPTGYGLKTTFGTSAGTQDFDSVMDADVILVIGANPTDGHPVFASRMKRRLRQGAKLIVIDPRRIDLVRIAACRGGASSAAPARHQCRGADRDGACHRDRGAGRRGLHPRALRLGRLSGLGGIRFAGPQQSPRRSRASRACRRTICAPRRGSTRPAAMPRSITASA